jgi:hypothetical protein
MMDTLEMSETSPVGEVRLPGEVSLPRPVGTPTETELLKLYEMQYRDSHLAALWAVYDLGRDDAAKELRGG